MSNSTPESVSTTEEIGFKPLLRGYFHLGSAVLTIPATILMVLRAEGGDARASALVFGISLLLLFSVSASYHVPYWPVRIREFLRRLDHGMIFLHLGGSYTPVCLLALPRRIGVPLLCVAWGVSILGFCKTVFTRTFPRVLRTIIYWCSGWIILPFVDDIYRSMPSPSFALLVAGGAVISVGSVVYVKRWPNPNPRVFGYHEIFHFSTVLGLGCHFGMVWGLCGA